MFIKIFVPALFLSVTVQVSSSVLAPLSSPIETAKELIDRLTEVTTENVKKADQALKQTRKDLASFSERAMADSVLQLQDYYSDLQDQLDKIKKNAEERGIDISKCLENNEAQFKGLPKKYVKKIEACNFNETAAADSIFNTAINNVQSSYQTVISLIREVNQCKNEDACINQVIEKIKKTTDEMPGQIGGNVATAFKKVTIVQIAYQECTINGAHGLLVAGGDIVKTIEACVKGL